MAYNQELSNRVREELSELPDVEEKIMFGGICYMVNDKMCVGIQNDELMCRIGPEAYEREVEKNGVREMIFTGRAMKGFVYVSNGILKTQKDLQYWINLCLEFNVQAKPSAKKSRVSGKKKSE